MCDEHIEKENKIWLGRREFGLMGIGTTAAVIMTGIVHGMASAASTRLVTRSETIKIETPDGSADALFTYPEEGSHAAVLIWPDIGGLRSAYGDMSKRLASAGYAVLVINQYYRSAKAPIINTLSEYFTDEGRAKFKPMITAITPEGTASDAAAFVDWLDTQPMVDQQKKIGTCGYCMGGPFVFRTAAVRVGRIGALCSFHGANLVTDAPDSPHLLVPKLEAAILIAIAQNDDARQPEVKNVLHEAVDTSNLDAEIEVYPAQHGWCMTDAPVYDPVQAEKAWGRMLTLFSQAL